MQNGEGNMVQQTIKNMILYAICVELFGKAANVVQMLWKCHKKSH